MEDMDNQSLKDIIGDEFYTPNDAQLRDFSYVDNAEEFVGLYFGDYLTPQSKKFTPVLIDFYGQVNARAHILEIVYVSYDKNFKNYKTYVTDMPWVVVPFGDRR